MGNRFMSNEQQQSWVDAALELTNTRLNSDSKNTALYKYILKQLDYINNCLKDKAFSREKLSDINLGKLAVKEFESVDAEYSGVLKKAYFIVHHMKEGKKVPLLDEDGNIVKS